MLYTTVPWWVIFPNDRDNESERMLMTVDGRPCLVRRGADGRPRIERLLSTDPMDFLDARFFPETPLDSRF